MKSAEKDLIPTPGEIWKILKEVSLSQKETDRLLRESKQENDRRKLETDRKIQENDRLLRESKQENDRLLQKSQKKLEKMIEENKLYVQQIDSRWGNEWGKLVEALIEGNFIDLLNKKGIKVTKANPNYKGRRHNENKEFDLVATNGTEIMVVETKSTLTKGKVNKFLKVMNLFKEYCPEFGALTVYGGMACLKGSPEALSYAESQGLLVLKVSGHNAILVNKPQFKPKVFC